MIRQEAYPHLALPSHSHSILAIAPICYTSPSLVKILRKLKVLMAQIFMTSVIIFYPNPCTKTFPYTYLHYPNIWILFTLNWMRIRATHWMHVQLTSIHVRMFSCIIMIEINTNNTQCNRIYLHSILYTPYNFSCTLESFKFIIILSCCNFNFII